MTKTPTLPGIGAASSTVDPEASLLTYRGYPVQELCRRCSFEEVAYLLWHGELPTHDQIYAQNHAERAQRTLDPRAANALARQPTAADPMETLQLAVRLLGEADPVEQDDVTVAAQRARALRLYAVLPTIVALDQRRRHGLGAIAPRNDLSYAANFLYMTFGKVPEPQIVAAFEKSLILHCEPSRSGSALSGRAGPPASDLYGAVDAAMSELKRGPHSGACETVLAMMHEIAIPDNAKPWLEEALADGRHITGFGQPGSEYCDVRVPPMRAGLAMIAALRGGGDLIEIYDSLADAMSVAKGLVPNLDYATGPAYHLIGFDTLTFTPILATAQLPCWTGCPVPGDRGRAVPRPEARSRLTPDGCPRPYRKRAIYPLAAEMGTGAGVYGTFTGEVGWEARLWAAVLYAGPGALLSHETAAEVLGLIERAAGGSHFPLEFRYDRDVERAHGLPSATRQAKFVKFDGRSGFRDRYYEKYGLIVELDGKEFHPEEQRGRDRARDNEAAATVGATTVRYGWADVDRTPCDTASQVYRALRKRGYRGSIRPCSATCRALLAA